MFNMLEMFIFILSLCDVDYQDNLLIAHNVNKKICMLWMQVAQWLERSTEMLKIAGSRA